MERYEAGTLAPTIPALYRIALALAVPVGDLFDATAAAARREDLADVLRLRPGEDAEAALLHALEPFADLLPRVQRSMAQLIRAVAAV